MMKNWNYAVSHVTQNHIIIWVIVISVIFAIIVVIVVVPSILQWAREIIGYHSAVAEIGDNSVINMTIDFQKQNYIVEFLNSAGAVIYPFGARQIQLRMFYQIINSKNKHRLQKLIDTTVLEERVIPNIKMPIIIRYKQQIYYYSICFNYYNVSKKKIYGVLFANNLAIIYEDLISEYRYCEAMAKNDTIINNLECINVTSNKKKMFLEAISSHVGSVGLKMLGAIKRSDSSIIQKRQNRKISMQPKYRNRIAKNIILVCFQLQDRSHYDLHFQNINNELYSYPQSFTDFIVLAMKEAFGVYYHSEISITNRSNVLVFAVHSIKYTSNSTTLIKLKLAWRMHKYKLAIHRLTNSIKNRDKLRKIRTTFCHFEYLPPDFWINSWITKQVYPLIWVRNNYSQQQSSLQFYSHAQIKLIQKSIIAKQRMCTKSYQRLRLRYRSVQVQDQQKKKIIGVLVLIYDKRSTHRTSNSTLKTTREKIIFRTLNEQIHDFTVLFAKLKIGSLIKKHAKEVVFFPIQIQLFLSFQKEWLSFFQKNQNFIPCFWNFFTSRAQLQEISIACEAKKQTFGVFNYSLIDPRNRDFALQQKLLSYFFVSEKSVNYMLKFQKYFIPGIVNLGDLRAKNTKVIFPFRKNEFYLYKFCHVGARYFWANKKIFQEDSSQKNKTSGKLLFEINKTLANERNYL